jgi:hypothetical protein
LHSLEATALSVTNAKDGKVVVRIVLLLEILKLVIELLASVGINFDRALGFSTSGGDFTNGDCALLGLNGLLLNCFEVGLDVESPKAVDQYHQSDNRDGYCDSNDSSVVGLDGVTLLDDWSNNSLLAGVLGLDEVLDSLVLDCDRYILGNENRLLVSIG